MADDKGLFGMDWDGDGKVDVFDDFITYEAWEQFSEWYDSPEQEQERANRWVAKKRKQWAREEENRQRIEAYNRMSPEEKEKYDRDARIGCLTLIVITVILMIACG